MKHSNLFLIAHKGLKSLFYETAFFLQQTDFSVKQELESALDKIGEVILLTDEHNRIENKFILDSISDFEPSLADKFKSDHALAANLGTSILEIIEGCTSDLSRTELVKIGNRLNESFNRYMLFNLEQINKEDNYIQKILERYYSAEEVLETQKQIINSTDPWFLHLFIKTILKSLNTTETYLVIKTTYKRYPDLYNIITQFGADEYSGFTHQNKILNITKSLKAA